MTRREPDRYGYGEAGHPYDPERDGRCRKRWTYCDGTRADPQHTPRYLPEPCAHRHDPEPCAACAADRADIGAFDRGIPHTYGPDCTVPAWRRR